MKSICVLGFLLLVWPMLANSRSQAGSPQNASAQQSAAGSAGGSSTATPAGEMGFLRVYRQKRYAGSALAPSIYVDDKQIARVGNGRRVAIRLSPGTHTIRSDDKSSAITLDAKSGQDYFVRIDEATGFWKGHGRLTLVLPEQGGPEYKLEKPIEEERKIAKEMILSDADDSSSKN